MKKYYAICSSYYDNGNIVANLVDIVEEEEKPQNTHKRTSNCDVYVDWFETYESAMRFIEECKK